MVAVPGKPRVGEGGLNLHVLVRNYHAEVMRVLTESQDTRGHGSLPHGRNLGSSMLPLDQNWIISGYEEVEERILGRVQL